MPSGKGDMDPLTRGGKCPQGTLDKDPVMGQRFSEFMPIIWVFETYFFLNTYLHT